MKIISVGFCSDLDDLNSDIIKTNGFVAREYESTYLKPDGSQYKKFTKWKPKDTYCLPLVIGGYNQFGHKLLSVETCYIIK